MPASRCFLALRADDGSAALEFLSLGVLLLIPLVYLVVALASIQGAQLATQGAARQAARVYVQSTGTEQARLAASRAVRYALADFGIDSESARVQITCRPNPRRCLAAGGTVSVTVRTTAELPLTPLSSGDARHGVLVEGAAVQPVSRFRESPP